MVEKVGSCKKQSDTHFALPSRLLIGVEPL